MKVKNNLSAIMGAKRLNFRELSEQSKINKNTLLNIYHERTKGISWDVLIGLCDALGCSVGELLEVVSDSVELPDSGVKVGKSTENKPQKKRGLFGF